MSSSWTKHVSIAQTCLIWPRFKQNDFKSYTSLFEQSLSVKPFSSNQSSLFSSVRLDFKSPTCFFIKIVFMSQTFILTVRISFFCQPRLYFPNKLYQATSSNKTKLFLPSKHFLLADQVYVLQKYLLYIYLYYSQAKLWFTYRPLYM